MLGPCYTETWKAGVDVADNMYSAETIAFASTICILVSLSAGCSLGFIVATYRRSAVRDLTSKAASHWTPTSEKDGTEVVSNGTASVPLARLYAVFGSRHDTVTSRTSDRYALPHRTGNRYAPPVDKACQTAEVSSCKSTPTRRPMSTTCRRVNLPCSPNSSVFISDYARRPSEM